VQTRSIGAGTRFDIDASGASNFVGWVAEGDGLLVRDVNGNGSIDDGSELFGSATALGNGDRAKDAFEALAQFDGNSDGRIDAQDAVFKDLRVWLDGDADGLSGAGELKSLTDLGITSLNLAAQTTSIDNHGNTIGLLASYETADGQIHQMADVWLAASADLNSSTAALADALDGYLASAEAGEGASTVTTQDLLVQKDEATVVSMASALAQFDASGNPSASTPATLLNAGVVDSVSRQLIKDSQQPTVLGGTA
jgi:hypothetical protein